MLQKNSFIFQQKDTYFYFRTIQSFLIIIGFYLLTSDLIPVLGLISTSFFAFSLVSIVFYLYKKYKWHANFIPSFKFLIILPLIISCIGFYFYFESKLDFFIIIAKPLQLFHSVEAIPSSEKIEFLLGFFIFQGIPCLVLLTILAQRQKIRWYGDFQHNQMILKLFHPLYSEQRIISLENLKSLTYGTSDPIVRLFTNTNKMTITYHDKEKYSTEITLSKTPIPIFNERFFHVLHLIKQDSKITLSLFQELGDYLQQLIITRELITKSITYPLDWNLRFSKALRLIDINQQSDKIENIKVLISSQKGAIYRKSLGTIFTLIIGFIAGATGLLLCSLLPRLTQESIMVPEYSLDHGFNAEILFFGALSLIIFVFGFQLIIFSWLRLIGHTRLFFTNEGLFLGVKWTKFSKDDYFFPYKIINDVYPLLESFNSGLSLIWLDSPFMRVPIWRCFQDDENFKTIVKFIYREHIYEN